MKIIQKHFTDGACKSYLDFESVCKDGFFQKPFCRGAIGCTECGHIGSKTLPNCLDENISPLHIKSDGQPLYYKGMQNEPSDT